LEASYAQAAINTVGCAQTIGERRTVSNALSVLEVKARLADTRIRGANEGPGAIRKPAAVQYLATIVIP